MMYPSRPAELLVIDELKEARHRASRIRNTLISGLDKTSIPDDCCDIGEVNQLPFRVAVTLFFDSADDLKIINALEKVPHQRRQDWIRQCLVSGLSGIERSNIQENSSCIKLHTSKDAKNEKLPTNQLANIGLGAIKTDQAIGTDLDVDLDKLEYQRESDDLKDTSIEDDDLSSLLGLFK